MRCIFKTGVILSIFVSMLIAVSVAPPAVGTDAPATTEVDAASCPRPDMETLHYEFGWNGVAAAVAQVRINSDIHENSPVLRLIADAHTIGVARKLWKMDDRMEAIVHRETLEPIRVELNREEAGESYRTKSSFSRETGKAQIIDVRGTRVKKKEVKFGNAYEPLTLIVLVRCLDFHVGSQLTFDIVEGYKIYRVVLDVLEKEEIEVKAGKFEAFRVTPTFYKVKKSGKIRKEDIKAENVSIWVSADSRRHMLKITSKVFIGSVYGELVKVEK